MPSCPDLTSLSPLDPPPWRVDCAQLALRIAARRIQSAANLLEKVHAGLPEPPDIEDRQEGRKPYDQATEILATIECVLEDLRPAIEALYRSAEVTDERLEEQYHEWLKKVRRI